MQVALPRTQDAGKLQEQIQKQGQQYQDALKGAQEHSEALKRQRVNEFENVEKKIIKDDKDGQHQLADQHLEENKAQEEKEAEMDHPYLGNTIDFSG